MKKIIYAFVTLTIFLSSCGPSKEQIAAEEKRKLDSAAAAGQQQLLDQQAADQALADEAMNQETLKQQLIELKSQLAAEEIKMQDIQSYKLLRTVDEKAQQVGDQTKIIEELKNQITETEKQIN